MMFMSHQDAKQKQTELQFKHIWNKYFHTNNISLEESHTNQWKSISQVIFSHNPWKALFWSKGWLQSPLPRLCLQLWTVPLNEEVMLVEREVPLQPIRVASVFADRDKDELDDGDTSIIDKERHVSTLPAHWYIPRWLKLPCLLIKTVISYYFWTFSYPEFLLSIV